MNEFSQNSNRVSALTAQNPVQQYSEYTPFTRDNKNSQYDNTDNKRETNQDFDTSPVIVSGRNVIMNQNSFNGLRTHSKHSSKISTELKYDKSDHQESIKKSQNQSQRDKFYEKLGKKQNTSASNGFIDNLLQVDYSNNNFYTQPNFDEVQINPKSIPKTQLRYPQTDKQTLNEQQQDAETYSDDRKQSVFLYSTSNDDQSSSQISNQLQFNRKSSKLNKENPNYHQLNANYTNKVLYDITHTQNSDKNIFNPQFEKTNDKRYYMDSDLEIKELEDENCTSPTFIEQNGSKEVINSSTHLQVRSRNEHNPDETDESFINCDYDDYLEEKCALEGNQYVQEDLNIEKESDQLLATTLSKFNFTQTQANNSQVQRMSSSNTPQKIQAFQLVTKSSASQINDIQVNSRQNLLQAGISNFENISKVQSSQTVQNDYIMQTQDNQQLSPQSNEAQQEAIQYLTSEENEYFQQTHTFGALEKEQVSVASNSKSQNKRNNTVSPVRNLPVIERLYELQRQKEQKIEHQRRQIQMVQLQNCYSRPQISQQSREIAKNCNRKPGYLDLNYMSEKQRRIEEQKRYLESVQLQEVTGKPMISERARSITRDVGDLMNWKKENMKKKENMQRQKEERERQQIEKMQRDARFVNKESEKMIKSKQGSHPIKIEERLIQYGKQSQLKKEKQMQINIKEQQQLANEIHQKGKLTSKYLNSKQKSLQLSQQENKVLNLDLESLQVSQDRQNLFKMYFEGKKKASTCQTTVNSTMNPVAQQSHQHEGFDRTNITSSISHNLTNNLSQTIQRNTMTSPCSMASAPEIMPIQNPLDMYNNQMMNVFHQFQQPTVYQQWANFVQPKGSVESVRTLSTQEEMKGQVQDIVNEIKKQESEFVIKKKSLEESSVHQILRSTQSLKESKASTCMLEYSNSNVSRAMDSQNPTQTTNSVKKGKDSINYELQKKGKKKSGLPKAQQNKENLGNENQSQERKWNKKQADEFYEKNSKWSLERKRKIEAEQGKQNILQSMQCPFKPNKDRVSPNRSFNNVKSKVFDFQNKQINFNEQLLKRMQNTLSPSKSTKIFNIIAHKEPIEKNSSKLSREFIDLEDYNPTDYNQMSSRNDGQAQNKVKTSKEEYLSYRVPLYF